MSKRMGARKTLGSGWVSPVAAPSPPRMLTVGRVVAIAMIVKLTERRKVVEAGPMRPACDSGLDCSWRNPFVGCA